MDNHATNEVESSYDRINELKAFDEGKLGVKGLVDAVLLQDNVGGLQVLHENKWVNIEPIDGGLIVNFGNMLQGDISSEKIHGPLKELTSDENPHIYRKFSTEELIERLSSKSLDEIGSNLDYFKLQYHGDGN
uniref:Isopenicillin N synthase-like Fe(2+) 2OG dioxygenase domain-containing protein n=1 Tax=Chenopodium quinoa TaxID=63459 RepID=A0A803MZN3_CHEQI